MLKKNSPPATIKTQTAKLMELRILLKVTDFLTPAATIRVRATAMTSATKSGYVLAGEKQYKTYLFIHRSLGQRRKIYLFHLFNKNIKFPLKGMIIVQLGVFISHSSDLEKTSFCKVCLL